MTAPASGPAAPFDVPAPPSFVVDWDALHARFEWVRALRGCAQDPVHHAEGDVWIHTRMVLESLAAMPRFRALDAPDRFVAFAAALLHDVAKPECTRTDEHGRLTARGHSARGAIRARRILWELGVPPELRERVAGIVEHHQEPFFAIDKPDARRRVHRISHRTRCDLLAIVSEADIRGRTAADAPRILEQIELFRELCADEACLDRPRAFPSDHARVVYFRKEDGDPSHDAFDDCRAELVLLSGLPASGKDHLARTRFAGLPVVSLDALRAELDVDPEDPQGPVVAAARERARAHLRAGESFVWNATGLSRDQRRPVLALAAGYRARIRAVVCEASPDTLRRRNAQRRRPVPAAAIERMLGRWQPPDATEAHRVDVVES